jgi:hypothetical protein
MGICWELVYFSNLAFKESFAFCAFSQGASDSDGMGKEKYYMASRQTMK